MTKYNYKTVANIRRELKMTHSRFGMMIGTNAYHIKSLERKGSDPRVSTIVKIANAAGKPLGLFFEEVL